MRTYGRLLPVTVALLSAMLCACGKSANSSLLNDSAAPVVPTQGAAFPIMPNDTLTPGKICDTPASYRYAEHIAYCDRNVSTGEKNGVIHTYDIDFGYTIESMNRQDFKIDHYISLCMGGANDSSNLWPQHKSVFVLTDPIEADLCQLLAAGKMLQAEAITKIKFVKHNLDQAPQMQKDLEAQLH